MAWRKIFWKSLKPAKPSFFERRVSVEAFTDSRSPSSEIVRTAACSGASTSLASTSSALPPSEMGLCSRLMSTTSSRNSSMLRGLGIALVVAARLTVLRPSLKLGRCQALLCGKAGRRPAAIIDTPRHLVRRDLEHRGGEGILAVRIVRLQAVDRQRRPRAVPQHRQGIAACGRGGDEFLAALLARARGIGEDLPLGGVCGMDQVIGVALRLRDGQG